MTTAFVTWLGTATAAMRILMSPPMPAALAISARESRPSAEPGVDQPVRPADEEHVNLALMTGPVPF